MLRKASILLGAVAMAANTWVAAAQEKQQAQQEVTLQFGARAGAQPFRCGQSYDNLGLQGGEIVPADFRLYVSEIALIDVRGNAVPLQLRQDGRWQHDGVALLDLKIRPVLARMARWRPERLLSGLCLRESTWGCVSAWAFRWHSIMTMPPSRLPP